MNRPTSTASEFDAPAVLAEGCSAFAGDPDEPGICGSCGWLLDEHLETLAA